MGFWSNLLGAPSDNPNGGDPDGVVFEGDIPETRSLPKIVPSPWAGWPSEWATPTWDFGSRFNELVDVAWNCLDLNSSVLSTMPVYRTRNGEVIGPETWMMNPDPTIYASWEEFAKQLFWDYQTGEAFVLPTTFFSDGFPMHFRVVPPWVFDVEMQDAGRVYRLGGPRGVDVTDDILHIRYKSTTADARGIGPLEVAGARMLTAGVLAKYVRNVVETGGVPTYTLETADELSEDDAIDLMNQWVASRAANLGAPPVLDNGVALKTHMAMSPKDMAMIEIAQFTEGRIADLLRVPRALVGLPTGDSFTYSNVSSWFDHHDRAGLRPMARHVMSALSNWALPRGQAAELNRDEYSRPAFNERAESWVKLVEAGIVSVDEVRAAERFAGPAPTLDQPEQPATIALTGGDLS
jgi:HK97 family phage portal protein